ncbi:unnamed protein product [Cochlearia groenlandica]
MDYGPNKSTEVDDDVDLTRDGATGGGVYRSRLWLYVEAVIVICRRATYKEGEVAVAIKPEEIPRDSVKVTGITSSL